ncbi:MAG TPA: lipoprotein [Lysobacter sp.]
MNARIAPRRPKAAFAALLIALPLVLAGCGNKGPLILPPKEIPVDPSTLPSADNPNVAMPPAETTDDAEPASDTPAQDAPAPATPTDEPSKGDDDGGRG